jgi:hypothetical protein
LYHAKQKPSLLTWIVSDMIDQGQHGGIEVGFFEAIALAAMRSQAR